MFNRTLQKLFTYCKILSVYSDKKYMKEYFKGQKISFAVSFPFIETQNFDIWNQNVQKILMADNNVTIFFFFFFFK